MQTILLLKSALLCVFRFFGLSSFDTVTTLILSRLASFLPFFEVIPEIYGKFAKSYFYPDKTPEKGDYYIDANLFDLKGDSCKLTDYLNKGKYILLDFWDLYCAPCKKSVPGLKELFSSCADKLTIISINVGSRESQVKGSSDFLWENLSDGQGLTGIASRYGIKSIPCFILIAPNGRIEKYWKGYAMHHSGMEKEIMEIILPNPSPTEASK